MIICSAVRAAQPPPPGQKVTLGWTASSDPTVTGYYLYYGPASGAYTNRVDVGTNLTYSVSGIVSGATYYFTTTAYNASRVESVTTAEVSYAVPGVLTLSQSSGSGSGGGTMHIQFPVAGLHSYIVQASPDMVNWSNIVNTGVESTNTWVEYDEAVTNSVTSRFYRLILQ